MCHLVFKVVLICCAAGQVMQATIIPENAYYTAGIVEFRRTPNDLVDNLNGYVDIITSDKAAQTDIIVFPESTLNDDNNELTAVPDPRDDIVPCHQPDMGYHDFLRKISCVSRSTKKYIVINISEKENCSVHSEQDSRPCAMSGFNVFNTNVVFDRRGAVISRYRKVHLYGEVKNTTLMPEFAIFHTDFGVTFGHFICFDILFYTPAQEMVDRYGIKDFIYPTMWFSQLPFLTALQIQQGWSYANDVNLLTAGSSNPSVGSTGSGIFAGKQGPLIVVVNNSPGVRTLYVAQVPKYSTKSILKEIPAISDNSNANHRTIRNTDILLKRDYLQQYVTDVINLTNSPVTQQQLCYKTSFCCNFKIRLLKAPSATNTSSYTYRMAVFDGIRNEMGAETNFLKNCAIFACTGDTIDTCGRVYSKDVNVRAEFAFESIVIEAIFPKTNRMLIMPNSLDESIMPLPVDRFHWNVTENGNTQTVRYSLLNGTADNLLTFAIYANYYDNNSGEQARGVAWSSLIRTSSSFRGLLIAILTTLVIV